jgi:Arc/MetJ-type ribon-helix-helix transcriptional regulator
MQVELTGPTRQVVEQLLAEGRFQSPDEAVEYAVAFFHDCEPTRESLNAKLREAHQAHQAGQSVPLDMDDIKTELRKRIQESQDA